MKFLLKKFSKSILVMLLFSVCYIFLSGVVKGSIIDDIDKFFENITRPANIMVYGKLEDNNNKSISGATIRLISTTENNEKAVVTTNEKGEYYCQIPEGNYNIKIEYPNNGNTSYTTESITKREHKLYTQNLEIAFIYPESKKNKIKIISDNKITDNSIKQRVIDEDEGMLYTDLDSMKTIIKGIEKNLNSKFSFLKIWIKDWENIAVILTNNKEDAKATIDSKYGDDSDYNFIICSPSDNPQEILKSIYQKLMIAGYEQKSTFIETDTIEFKANTNMNIKSKKEIQEVANLSTYSTYPNFINGKITIDGTTTPIKNAKVKLKRADGAFDITYTNDSGEFNFNYPGGGTFYIEYDFKDAEHINGLPVNAQYFESNGNSKSVNNATYDDNCIYKTNLDSVIEKWSKEIINYEKENALDINNTDSNLIASTKSFNIPSISEDWTPESKQLYAGAILKERERFRLNVTEKISNYKIILSNGQVYSQYKNENKPKVDLGFFNIILENDLRYGAKLFVEYKITVENLSETIDCNEVTLLSRFENLKYDEKRYLLNNVDKTNKEFNWEEITKDEVEKLIGKEDTEETMTYLKTTIKNISKQTAKDIYITMNMSLDANDNDECIFFNSTEIISYKNTKGRRNYSKTNEIARAGNYIQEKNEDDSSEAEYIAILPPTGLNIKIKEEF